MDALSLVIPLFPLLAALFAILLSIITRFSINYLHRGPGFHSYGN